MEIGEIKRSYQIGRRGHARYIWLACPDCNKTRWVQIIGNKPTSQRCHRCAMLQRNLRGIRNPRWTGGKVRTYSGYIQVKLLPDDFFYSMADHDSYVREHRLVMAKHLGRCLQSWEHVHHKNGIKDDNRIENLKLTTKGSHSIEHSRGYRDGYRQGFNDRQSEAMKELRQEIKLLQWQLREVVTGRKIG